MATRMIGSALVRIEYHALGDYRGSIQVGRKVWRFDHLYAPAVGFGAGVAYDSPEAYDRMAQSAVAFASYYTSHNRAPGASKKNPEGYPTPSMADAIEEATSHVLSDEGYAVVRGLPA